MKLFSFLGFVDGVLQSVLAVVLTLSVKHIFDNLGKYSITARVVLPPKWAKWIVTGMDRSEEIGHNALMYDSELRLSESADSLELSVELEGLNHKRKPVTLTWFRLEMRRPCSGLVVIEHKGLSTSLVIPPESPTTETIRFSIPVADLRMPRELQDAKLLYVVAGSRGRKRVVKLDDWKEVRENLEARSKENPDWPE